MALRLLMVRRSTLRRAMLLLAATLLAAVPAAAEQTDDEWYIGKPIKAVEFIGLVTVEESDLRSIVDPYLEQSFDLYMFFEMQGELYATELFDSLEADAYKGDEERSSVIIRWSVRERPTIDEVIIEGYRRLREGQIRGVMVSEPDTILNTRQVEGDLDAIRTLYEEDGFGVAAVAVETVTDAAANRVTLRITIAEGIRTTVVGIEFAGNDFESASTLRNQMHTKQRALLQRGLFAERVFQLDLQRIVGYYRSNGYVDSLIDRVERSIEHDEAGEQDLLTLTLYLTEGQSFGYAGTEFVGNTVFSTEELQELVRHRPDRGINLSTVEADYQRVQELYFENGYIFNNFEQELIRDEEQGTIWVRVQITERDGAHIENITITGNEKTQEHVLRRELPFEVGDIFNRTEIIRGLQNIFNLQFFASAEQDTPPGSAPGLIDVNIVVEETTTADVAFGATFSGGDFPLSGFVRWSERNFHGLGQTVSVDLAASQLQQSVSLSFRDSWVFGQPWSAGAILGGEHTLVRRVPQDVIHPVFTDGEADHAVPDPYVSTDEYNLGDPIPDQYTMEYDTFAISAGVSIGYRFDTLYGWLIVRGGFSSSLEFLHYDPQVNRPFDKTIRNQFERWSVVNSLNAALTWDRRDFFLNPTDGTLLSQGITLTGGFLSGNRHFIVLDTRAEAFTTLFEVPLSDTFDLSFVLAGHTGFSVILPQLRQCRAVNGEGSLCWDQVTSPEDLLLIDGSSVGRGWEPVVDGQALWDNKLELRAPLNPQVVWGVLFLDAAVLWTDRAMIARTGLDDVHFSAGFGLRFAVPQLPLRFYLAKPFAFENGRIVDSGSNGMNFVIALGSDAF